MAQAQAQLDIPSGTPEEPVCICIVGRGNMTEVQANKVAKAFGYYRIVKKIETLSSNPREACSQLKGCDVVISLVQHPMVIDALAKAKKMGCIKSYATFNVVAITTVTAPTAEEARKLAAEKAVEASADLIMVKQMPDGTFSARISRTEELMIEPEIVVKAKAVIK